MNSADSNRLELRREAFRLAELNLQSEMTLALAADQRAVTFSGILIAALAFVATTGSDSASDWTDDLSIVFLAVAAALSAFVARSAKIYATGVRFDDFKNDIALNRPVPDIYSELGKAYDRCSRSNRDTLRRNGRLFNLSLLSATIGFSLAAAPNFIVVTQAFASNLRKMVGG